MFYYTMCHRGGLMEALETMAELSEEVGEKLIKSGIYEYYCFDRRLNAQRYILKDMDQNQGLPTWILNANLPIDIRDQINSHSYPMGFHSR